MEGYNRIERIAGACNAWRELSREGCCRLPADTDPAALIDMLAGPIYLRRFIQGQPVTATEIDELAARVVAAFTPRPK